MQTPSPCRNPFPRSAAQHRSARATPSGSRSTHRQLLKLAGAVALIATTHASVASAQTIIPVTSTCAGAGSANVGQPVAGGFTFYSSIGFGTSPCTGSPIYAGAPGLVPGGSLSVYDQSSGDLFDPLNPPTHIFTPTSGLFASASSLMSVHVFVQGTFLGGGTPALWDFILPAAATDGSNAFATFLFPSTFTGVNSLQFQFDTPSAFDLRSLTLAQATAIDGSVAPEPASLALLASGLVSFGAATRLRRKPRSS